MMRTHARLRDERRRFGRGLRRVGERLDIRAELMDVGEGLREVDVAGLDLALSAPLRLRLRGLERLEVRQDRGERRRRARERGGVRRHGLHYVVRVNDEVRVSPRNVESDEDVEGLRHEASPFERRSVPLVSFSASALEPPLGSRKALVCRGVREAASKGRCAAQTSRKAEQEGRRVARPFCPGAQA